MGTAVTVPCPDCQTSSPVSFVVGLVEAPNLLVVAVCPKCDALDPGTGSSFGILPIEPSDWQSAVRHGLPTYSYEGA